jgi:hypothetical protein
LNLEPKTTSVSPLRIGFKSFSKSSGSSSRSESCVTMISPSARAKPILRAEDFPKLAGIRKNFEKHLYFFDL